MGCTVKRVALALTRVSHCGETLHALVSFDQLQAYHVEVYTYK
ncbi:hypothetical protein YPPY66_2116 [Yersinia pestis PY-66]|uniref:Uncharacterized protein n=2 Tax=Yersinia pestis TaxID=632 RepID=Q8CL98_YERPE|nr:hypothetical [Yersinia pestis KIM10+]ABX88140.1 conserved hypothetical protein [Yersinia pestis Angola]EIQ90006.1 hypothetical protein YPPY01_1845 [Yersinia pestis PY-01]EIQ91231.1 hypothetical protein YPPY02_1876 [Yersinia pestis PY-02]EIQ92454.1 hypothetical protein YPPY03_1966 [Yersinia pestis PY-03]EIR03757.1 hypothetical protein YPPY04_1909 [Yersinia pestis PY-04]EIR04937.1 hypothetical protein YPPY05_1891 [Yersinia pestis PY-05]EIR07698.1 hypothetical protein YPPY06_1954 [Yersinia p